MSCDGDRNTRARILEAAEASFGDAGYHGTRLHDIAKRVGVQKPSLFHHFASKEELYREVVGQGFGESELMIRRILEQGLPPLATMHALADACVDMVAAHPARTKILLRQSIGDAPLGRRPSEADRMLRPLLELIEAGRRSGAFVPVDPLAFVLGLIGAVVFFFASASTMTHAWDAGGPDGVSRIKQHVKTLVTRTLTEHAPSAEGRVGGTLAAW